MTPTEKRFKEMLPKDYLLIERVLKFTKNEMSTTLQAINDMANRILDEEPLKKIDNNTVCLSLSSNNKFVIPKKGVLVDSSQIMKLYPEININTLSYMSDADLLVFNRANYINRLFAQEVDVDKSVFTYPIMNKAIDRDKNMNGKLFYSLLRIWATENDFILNKQGKGTNVKCSLL